MQWCKSLNVSDKIACRNFITARQNPNLYVSYYFDKFKNEEFVIFNYNYKDKIDLENEKKSFRKIYSIEI